MIYSMDYHTRLSWIEARESELGMEKSVAFIYFRSFLRWFQSTFCPRQARHCLAKKEESNSRLVRATFCSPISCFQNDERRDIWVKVMLDITIFRQRYSEWFRVEL